MGRHVNSMASISWPGVPAAVMIALSALLLVTSLVYSAGPKLRWPAPRILVSSPQLEGKLAIAQLGN